MAINDKVANDTNRQSQGQIANQSFDQKYQVSLVHPIVYNVATDNLDRMVQPTTPSDTQPVSGTVVAKNNDVSIQTETITANGQTVATDVTGYSMVFLLVSGTFGNAQLEFEGSLDGSLWFSLLGGRVDSNSAGTSTATITNITRAWRIPVQNLVQFRVRASAFTSGTINVSLTKTTIATEFVPIIGTHAVTQSGTWNLFTLADNAGFTDGTSRVSPNGYIFDEVAGTALTENDIAAGRVDSKRAQIMTLEDGTTRGLRNIIDPISKGLLGIDNAHYHLHNGRHFLYSTINTIALASDKLYRIVTPNTATRCHFEFQAVTDGLADVYFYEAPTVTGNGIDRSSTIKNNERNSATTPTLTLFEDPTVSDNGAILYIGMAGTDRKVGGEERGESEWVLKQNTTYLLRVNTLATNVKVLVRMHWYEF